MDRFPEDLLAGLAAAREIDLMTVGRRTGEPRRATIWVVVDGDVPYVRSEYGDDGQWYRNVLAQARATLVLGGQGHEVVATRVTDPDAWRRVSDAFRAKYRGSSAVRVMVRAEVEPTTLALAPAA